MKPASVNAIFATLAKADPHPKTELYFTNDYTLLVAIVLSAQATDAGVNKATTETPVCQGLYAAADGETGRRRPQDLYQNHPGAV